jgi:choice-of-anchor A domain-containing protein
MKSRLFALVALLASSAAYADAISFDLGQAKGFSGFFFGNVTNVVDVEGRLAVGGNLNTTGFSVGYRTPYGYNGPSLVVGGNVHIGGGAIYTGPATNIDTNVSIGPITEWEKQIGYGVFGGSNTSPAYLDLRHQGNLVDFAGAQTQLNARSSNLASQTANGTVEFRYGSVFLTGDNHSDTQVFNVNSNQLSNLVLENVKADAKVLVNVTGNYDSVQFSGGQTGQWESLRDRVIFNVTNAREVNVNTFLWGTILATHSNVIGHGHLEGNLVAQSISSNLEIGYEPSPPTTPVPEPETYAMLGLGLAGLAWFKRRKAASVA